MKNISWRITEKNALLLALALSLAVRLSVFFVIYPDTEILMESDQKIYLRLAAYLGDTWDLGAGFGSGRAPLYPLFITLCQKVSENLFFLLGVQNVIGLASVFIVYKMGRLFSGRAAMWGALFAGANMNFAVLSNSVLTESIFYPVFGFFLLRLLTYSREKSIAEIAAAGFVLGLCTLIRPVVMFLPGLVCFYLLLVPRMKFKTGLRHAAAFFLMWAFVVAPWVCRNYEITGYAGITSQGEPHIVGWIVPGVMQYEEGMDLKKAVEKSTEIWSERRTEFPESVQANQFALDREAKKFAVEYLSSCGVLSIAKAWFWGTMKNLFAPVTIELAYMLKMDWTHFYESPGSSFPEQAWNFVVHNKNRAYAAMLVLGIGGMLIFRLLQTYGAWRMWRGNRESFLVGCLIIGYFLLISGPVGYGKYRVPFEPVLILFTALAFPGTLRRDTSEHARRDTE